MTIERRKPGAPLQTDGTRPVLEMASQREFPGDGVEAAAGVSEPNPQEIAALVGLFSEGRYTELASLARAMTVRFPRHWFSWKVLGATFKQMGRNADALPPLQKATTLSPTDPEAHNNLGSVLQELSQLQKAEVSYRRALEIEPDYAQAHNNVGVTLYGLRRIDEAVASYRKALNISPDYAEASSNLGNALQVLSRLDEAEASFRRALEIRPDFAAVYNNLGVTLHDLNRPDESEASCRRALRIDAGYAEAHNDLGNALQALSKLDEAEVSFRQALQIRPGYPEAHNNLGNSLKELGRMAEAESHYSRALLIKADYAEAHYNLASTLTDLGRLNAAEASYRRALAIRPELAEAHNNLGTNLRDMGHLADAEISFRRAVEIKPDFAEASSNLLFSLNYASARAPSYYLAEARQYGQKVSSKITARFREWSCARQPTRLRIGFVSGDFRNHPVGYFLESLLTRLDPTSIELIAYPTFHNADELTTRIRPYFTDWNPLFGHSDEAAAHRIHKDNLHILVDLSGHTRFNRLPVFAWKPAPVQVSWLGYFATTGVPEIDYLLGDRHVAPADEASHFTEKLWRLPGYYMCFTAPNVAIEVAPLPALATGALTFGCFNNLTKMNDAVVAVWATILRTVAGSKLFLKAKQFNEPMMREATLRRFAKHGIRPDRLILAGPSPRSEYLASYHRVDIALDPFPYPGGATSMEGLWMGVPVMTKCGDRFLSHQGESIVHNAGLPNWVAANDNDYVDNTVAFASDVAGLGTLRAGLRQQVLASPLCDAGQFARHFEEAMWGMWNDWLEKEKEVLMQ